MESGLGHPGLFLTRDYGQRRARETRRDRPAFITYSVLDLKFRVSIALGPCETE